MPLPESADRRHVHTRQYRFQGYERADGLFDIEGHLSDAKTYPFPNAHRGEFQAGEAYHDMWIRLTLDLDFIVRDVEAVTDSAPYAICPLITPNFKKIIGLQIGPGWRQSLRKTLGGTEGCTHLVEMLGAMATVAFQTLYPALAKREAERPSEGKPALIDSCHAYASDSPVVREQWPQWYTGADETPAKQTG